MTENRQIAWEDGPRGTSKAVTHPLIGRTVVRIPPAVCPPRGAPLARHERQADAVVIGVERTAGRWGSSFDRRTLYGLQWPDGGVTWHRRSEFELVLVDQD